jgi:UDP-N-acetylglucosamine acyltransferase
MAKVHPTAILEGEIDLAGDVVIGPHCVLSAPAGTRIAIAAGTQLIGNAYLTGPLTIGERNMIYPFVSLGFPPQDLKWDPAVPGAGLVIGRGNTFRESVSIHRATSHEKPTVIGDGNYWMACSHAGHDCVVGSNCIFANSTLLGGFVRIDDKVITGGNSGMHQFCRVGRGAMLSGEVAATKDVPPFFMLTGFNLVGSINLIGLRRAGTPRESIDMVRWVFRTLYRSGKSPQQSLETLRTRGDHPIVREYIEFVEGSSRGIVSGRGKASRGTMWGDTDAADAAGDGNGFDET